MTHEELKQKALSNKNVKNEYDKLDVEFQLLNEITSNGLITLTSIAHPKIVVIDEGSVVGVGNHQELLKTCKVYQEIALSQLSKEELNNGSCVNELFT